MNKILGSTFIATFLITLLGIYMIPNETSSKLEEAYGIVNSDWCDFAEEAHCYAELKLEDGKTYIIDKQDVVYGDIVHIVYSDDDLFSQQTVDAKNIPEEKIKKLISLIYVDM